MSIYQELINFDEVFSQLKTPPIIINDILDSSEEEREKLKSLMYTRYNSDLLSNLPSCECGETTGEYNIGVECEICHTPVTSPMEGDIEPILWMRSPKNVARLINPMVFTMINDRFKRSNFEIILWICDSAYRSPVKIPKVLQEVQEAGIQRGYNYFVENFDYIMGILFNIKSFKLKRGERDYLQEILTNFKSSLFSNYLPLPNKALLVIEDTNVGTWIDPIIPGAVNAMRTIASIDSSLSQHSTRVKENRTIKAIAQLAEFNGDYFKASLSRKPGIFRKHVYGSRSHFSFRAVISSITDSHSYDNIYIPWGVGTAVFKIHLMNKLLSRGMSSNVATGFLSEHAQKYHPLLDELFKELIAEAPGGRIPCICQRNPSLMRGSVQLTYISKVKTDPNIPTVSISILITKSLNADS